MEAQAAERDEIPDYEIIKVPDSAEEGRDALKQQCLDLRIEVFSNEQGFPVETEIDDQDETAIHLLLRLIPSHKPIGTIRGYLAPSKAYYKLSRLVVLKEYRKFRFGGALVSALHEHIKLDAIKRNVKGPVEIVSHSQIYVKGFYAKFGYAPEGDEFDEDGAPHQKMVARLQLTN